MFIDEKTIFPPFYIYIQQHGTKFTLSFIVEFCCVSVGNIRFTIILTKNIWQTQIQLNPQTKKPYQLINNLNSKRIRHWKNLSIYPIKSKNIKLKIRLGVGNLKYIIVGINVIFMRKSSLVFFSDDFSIHNILIMHKKHYIDELWSHLINKES